MGIHLYNHYAIIRCATWLPSCNIHPWQCTVDTSWFVTRYMRFVVWLQKWTDQFNWHYSMSPQRHCVNRTTSPVYIYEYVISSAVKLAAQLKPIKTDKIFSIFHGTRYSPIHQTAEPLTVPAIYPMSVDRSEIPGFIFIVCICCSKCFMDTCLHVDVLVWKPLNVIA